MDIGLPPKKQRRRSPLVTGIVGALVIGAVIVAGVLIALTQQDDSAQIASRHIPPEVGAVESARTPVVEPPVISETPVTGRPSLPGDSKTPTETTTDNSARVDGSASEATPAPESATTRRTDPTKKGVERLSPPEFASPAARSLAAARTALSRREMEVAASSLDMATRLAETPAELAYLARMRMLQLWLTEFWAAFDRNRDKLQKGYKLKAAGTVYVIDEFRATNLTVTVDGHRHDYSVRDVPAPLAAALAARRFPKDSAYGKLCLATFWAIDSDGDTGRAVELLQEARLAGLPVDALAAELARDLKL